MPQDLINAKPAAAAVREFFGSSAAFSVYGSDRTRFLKSLISVVFRRLGQVG